ncbi:MAG: GNAT family N-acetyltransferase [Desulfovibrionaceae bacterium]
MLLRNAVHEDLPALETLCRTSMGLIYGSILPPEILREWTEGDAARNALEAQWPEMRVAELNGSLAGVMRIEDGNRVDLLWVAPALHRCGVGSALLRDAEQRIARTHDRAWLTVFKDNANARAFYELLDWRNVNEYRDENGVAVVRMEKRLGPEG